MHPDRRRDLNGRAFGAAVRASVVGVALALVACSSPEREPDTTSRALGPPTVEAVFGGPAPESLAATLDTELGTIRCTLEPARSPRAAALFVGLARGGARFRDPRSGAISTRRFYDGLVFHRRIPGVLVQSGCPLGDGTGTPGYRIPVERDPSDRDRLARAGVLLLASYTPPPGRVDPAPPPPGHTIGSQLGIGLVSLAHLTGTVTVLGRCGDLDVVRALAAVARGARSPRLQRVRVAGR